MDIVGYIAYATLILLTIVWTFNVRINFNADTPGILRAVYFIFCVTIIPALDMNMMHSLWMVPFGCFFAKIIAPVLVSIPVLSVPFIFAADGFARFARIGLHEPVRNEVTESSVNR